MKNYLSTRKGSSRRPFLPKPVLRALVIGLILISLYFLVPRFVTGVVAIVMYPADAVRVWFTESSASLPSYLRDRQTLLLELESLKQAVATNESSELTIAKLQTENEQFRQLLGAVPGDRVVARVVGRPADLPYDVLMLDRGTDHGVTVGAPVFAGQDQLIGIVARVYASTALVTLVTTSGSEVTAYIIGPNIYTYAEGVGGGIIRVRVPQGVLLRVGDPVIFPAVDSGVFGRVAEIVTSPTQPEQFGYVTLPISLQSLQYVTIGQQPVTTHSYEEAEALLDDVRHELFVVDLPPGVLVTPELATTSVSTTTSTTAPVVIPE